MPGIVEHILLVPSGSAVTVVECPGSLDMVTLKILCLAV